MKPDELNPKAREAYGKSRIALGTAIFKSILLLILIIPIAAVFKNIYNGKSDLTSFIEIISLLPISTKVMIIALIVIAMYAGHIISNEGFRHLHELENKR